MITKRKKTPTAIEADVLEKSGRRCCVCYALQRDFKVKRGQIAHLDHNSANSKFDNLCWLCRDHHDDYDAQRRQSKGLTLNEVKRYRSDLYKTITVWRESKQIISNSPTDSQMPLLNFLDATLSPIVNATTQGLKVIERHVGCRLADSEHHPKIILDIYFRDTVIGSRPTRILHTTTSTSIGLAINSEVSLYDNWNITGFMNVLQNNLDIWILHGRPLANDERDPMLQPTDSLLIYRMNDGENRLIISTHSISEMPIHVRMRISNKAIKGLATHLDTIGFLKPFKE